MAKKPEIISALKVPKIPKAPATKVESASVGGGKANEPMSQPPRAKAKTPAKPPVQKEMNRFPGPRKSARHTFDGEKF